MRLSLFIFAGRSAVCFFQHNKCVPRLTCGEKTSIWRTISMSQTQHRKKKTSFSIITANERRTSRAHREPAPPRAAGEMCIFLPLRSSQQCQQATIVQMGRKKSIYPPPTPPPRRASLCSWLHIKPKQTSEMTRPPCFHGNSLLLD